MLLLPASDAKAPVAAGGAPFDAGELSFPALQPERTSVLDALIAVSAAPDATARLGLRPHAGDLARANLRLREAPAAAVERVYAGVLHDALGVGDLDASARRRARSWVVVVSALWGAVRLSDRIPPYRLDMCGRLPGLPHLTDVWKGPLDAVLPEAAGRGVIVDLRSSEYATAWRPRGPVAERTVVVRVVRADDAARGAGGHRAKRSRGLLARRIAAEGVDARRPEELAEALRPSIDLTLEPPARPGRSWELRIVESVV